MSGIQSFSNVMHAMLKHEGVWEGRYTHIDTDAKILDQHDVHVKCEFPKTGPYAYIQYNHFIWNYGREFKMELPGVYREGRLWWDTETFHGSAWETHDGMILLNLERKDDPGARFFEIIVMGETGKHRARTWHWFKDGKLFKRTLCDEWRVDE
jgi:hypothetical protein